MMIKTIVLMLLTFSLTFFALAEEKVSTKKFPLLSLNKEGDRLSSIYYDADQKKMLVRVFKTKEKSLTLPKEVTHSIEILPHGAEFKILDDRIFDLSNPKQAKEAEEFLLKYNKSAFVNEVGLNSFKKCNTLSSVEPLSNSGNAEDLSDLSLNIADKLLIDNNNIVFKVTIAKQQVLLRAKLGARGEILALEFVDLPKDVQVKEKLLIIGPSEGIAYVYQNKKPVIKVSTENFTNQGGDFIVTLATPVQSRADFIESLYKIVVAGNKLNVNPRQVISPTIDYSNELQPTPGVDDKPTALGFKNFLANVVWGGGKEKTYKEIVSAGKEAVKEDPLLKQYLNEADVERIAKKIVDEGTVIEKNAFSEKPKVMGIAYLYFSEELLKKAIMQVMPMDPADLDKTVTNVMENFKVCIKKAKYEGGVEDCKNKFAKTAVVKIGKNIMDQQIESNLASAITGSESKKELDAIKLKAEAEYNRCMNKYFMLPYAEAEKNKKPLPDAMAVTPSCVYSSVQYSATLVVDKELEKTFKGMGIYKEGDEVLLTAIRKKNAGCYKDMGIIVDDLGRRTNLNVLKNQDTDKFKNGLIGCVNKQIRDGGQVAVQRTLETHPDLSSVLNDAKLSSENKAKFYEGVMSEGYDKCLKEIELITPPNSVINPATCETFITLKAKQAAFSVVLKNELAIAKPNPWESEISPKLKSCSDNFFKDYNLRKTRANIPQEQPVESQLTSCFKDAIGEASYYIGGALLDQEVSGNPSVKAYGIKLSKAQREKYQGVIKNCIKREIEDVVIIESITAIDPVTKKSKLDATKEKCTVEVAQGLVPEFARDILKLEMSKAIESETPENKAKLNAEFAKLIDPLIKDELIPRMKKISGMDDVTKKVIPAFTTEATTKAASTLLDFKLSAFAKDPEGKKRMKQVRDSILVDIRKEVSAGGSLTPKFMAKVEGKAVNIVSNTLIDQYLGTKYPQVAKTLSANLNQDLLKAMMEVEFVLPKSEGQASDKPVDMAETANTLGAYIDEALKYDPTIIDAVNDLQKRLLADIQKQKKAGKKPVLSVEQMLKEYWEHPAVKKIILSQVSKELSTQFVQTFKTMEADELKAMKSNDPNLDLVKNKYKSLRELAASSTSAQQMEGFFKSAQGAKALDTVRERMLMPMLKGKEQSAADKAAVTAEVVKTLTENRSNGSFTERFAAHNIQAELTADKRSRGAVVKGLMGMLGYKIENYEWDNLKKTPSGKKALQVFADQILIPSMTGQKFDMKKKKEELTELIKQGLKGE